MTSEISHVSNSIDIAKYAPRNLSPLGLSLSSSTSSSSDLTNLQNDLLPDLWQTSSTSSTASSYGKQLAYAQLATSPTYQPTLTSQNYQCYNVQPAYQNQNTPYQSYQTYPSYQPIQPTYNPQPQAQCQNVHPLQSQCTSQCASGALWKPYLSPISTDLAQPLKGRLDFPALTEENLYNMEVEPREDELFKFEAHPKDPVARRNADRKDESRAIGSAQSHHTIAPPQAPSAPSLAPVFIDSAKVNTQLYKTELCASFMKMGICPYGNKCQFAHGENELKIVDRPPNWRSKPCANWAKFGNCRYGSRCCFKHN